MLNIKLIIKVMFILPFISSDLEFWSVNHTSIYENAQLKVIENIRILVEISNNQSNDLFGINI